MSPAVPGSVVPAAARTASAEAADLDLIRLALREQSTLISALHASLTTVNQAFTAALAQVNSRLDAIIETLATLAGEQNDSYASADAGEHPPLPR